MAKQDREAVRLIELRFDLISSAPETLVAALPAAQSYFAKEITKLLSELKVENGRIVFDSNTASVINKIERKVRELVLSSPYQKEVSLYLNSFDQIKEASVEYFKASSKINVRRSSLNNLQKITVDQVNYSLLENGLDARFSNEIKRVLSSGAVSGQSVSAVQAELREFIKGADDALGFFERYVPQIAHDAINQYDGAIQTRVKNEYELNAWSYEGSIIAGSRPQCRRWVKMGVIKDSRLASEIQWAQKNGSGMIPDTEPATFGIYRGGFRCRHHATAILV